MHFNGDLTIFDDLTMAWANPVIAGRATRLSHITGSTGSR
jgi:hypothetical protein